MFWFTQPSLDCSCKFTHFYRPFLRVSPLSESLPETSRDFPPWSGNPRGRSRYTSSEVVVDGSGVRVRFHCHVSHYRPVPTVSRRVLEDGSLTHQDLLPLKSALWRNQNWRVFPTFSEFWVSMRSSDGISESTDLIHYQLRPFYMTLDKQFQQHSNPIWYPKLRREINYLFFLVSGEINFVTSKRGDTA